MSPAVSLGILSVTDPQLDLSEHHLRAKHFNASPFGGVSLRESWCGPAPQHHRNY